MVEAVRGFECLWQVGSKSYKDTISKENAWKEVAAKVSDYALYVQLLLLPVCVKPSLFLNACQRNLFFSLECRVLDEGTVRPQEEGPAR